MDKRINKKWSREDANICIEHKEQNEIIYILLLRINIL